ncbi:hypothetical protein FRC16_006221, partial [Serendipita sp. 398]
MATTGLASMIRPMSTDFAHLSNKATKLPLILGRMCPLQWALISNSINFSSHRNLATLSEAEIDYEIQRLDEAFIKILGVRPKFLRPPYGGIDER